MKITKFALFALVISVIALVLSCSEKQDNTCEVPSKPSVVAAFRTSKGNINVSWNTVANADYYEVYFTTSDYGTSYYMHYELVIGETQTYHNYNNYGNNNLIHKTTYYYKVRACNECGCGDLSEYATATTL
jgi:hypothetical protein